MTSDLPPTCRVCGHQGKVSLATWVRNDEAVTNWYLCDHHAGMLGAGYLTSYGTFTKLPTPVILPTGTRKENP